MIIFAGIWKARFRILHTAMCTRLRTTQLIIRACAVLHNMAVAWRDPDFEAAPEPPQVRIKECGGQGQAQVPHVPQSLTLVCRIGMSKRYVDFIYSQTCRNSQVALHVSQICTNVCTSSS